MKFTSTLALTAALVAGASAKLHQFGLCYYGPTTAAGYHEVATRAACAAYKLRNKGTDTWNHCEDCVITGTPPTCHSAGWHLGGDELSYYCKQAGAVGSFAS